MPVKQSVVQHRKDTVLSSAEKYSAEPADNLLTIRRQEMQQKHRWFQIMTGIGFFVTILVMTGSQKIDAATTCPCINATKHCHKYSDCTCPSGYTVHVHS